MGRGKYIRTEEHMNNWKKSRLGHIVTEQTKEKLRKASVNQWKRQHEEGFVSEKKNKTLEEMYGIEGAKLHRQKLKDGHKKNPHVGWHHTLEAKEKNKIAHLGIPTGRKGITWEQEYGIEKARKLRKRLHLVNLGKESSKKGKTNIEFYGEEKAKEIFEKNEHTFFKKGQKFYNNGKSMGYGSIGKIPGFNVNSKYKTGQYNSKNNGHVWYRSSWELKVMKYFDNNNTEWIYETKKNRFYLSSIERYYINDFYLPKDNKYIQVKGYVVPDDKFYIFQKEYSDLNSELWDNKILKDKGIL